MTIPNTELLAIISKQWANTQDIMKLANCGRNKATQIRQQIEKAINDSGLTTINHLVPMAKVVQALGIDEKRIIKYAEIERATN